MISAINNKVTFSVITVNLNNGNGLQRTLQSIAGIKNEDVELIVVDGGSSDNSLNIINEYIDIIDHYTSEADRGVYHAMNKGISLSTGRWLIFMNSGDCFYDHFNFEKIDLNKVTSKHFIIAGHAIFKEGVEVRKPTIIECLKLGILPYCHQALFFKSPVGYDEHFKIYSDFALFASIVKQNGLSCIHEIDTKVAIYESGGMSENKKYNSLKRKEKLIIINKINGLRGLATFFSVKIIIFFRKMFHA